MPYLRLRTDRAAAVWDGALERGPRSEVTIPAGAFGRRALNAPKEGRASGDGPARWEREYGSCVPQAAPTIILHGGSRSPRPPLWVQGWSSRKAELVAWRQKKRCWAAPGSLKT